MKVRLKKTKWPDSCRGKQVSWSAAKPFAVNPRGVLIHRVRNGDSHLREGVYSHFSVTYWCGNGSCEPELTDTPPSDRLLCVYCEDRAVAAGEKTADELAGRHVHTGSMKAKRACCLSEEN